MDSGAGFDITVEVAWGSATALFAVTLGLLLAIVWLRVALMLRRRRVDALLQRWRPHVARALQSEPVSSLPVLKRRDVTAFLALWNHAQESFRGEVKDRLNLLARQAGADLATHRLLGSRRVRHRLMAITALGHLRERAAWDALVSIANADNAVLSLTAVRALLFIDPHAALPVLIPLLKTRDDWPAPRVATMLHEAGPDIVSKPLAGAVLRASPEHAPRLIRYLEGAYLAQISGALGHLMKTASDDRVISACLQVLPDPAHLELVREFTRHERWHVRLHAARALGRLGNADDVPRLVEMLGDEQWWVRYRAAQSLRGMPGVTSDHVLTIIAALTDPFARDILTHVMAERGAA